MRVRKTAVAEIVSRCPTHFLASSLRCSFNYEKQCWGWERF